MTDKTKLDEMATLNVSQTEGGMNSTTTFTADDALGLAQLLKRAGVEAAMFNGPATLSLDGGEPGATITSVIQAPDLRAIMNLLEPEFQAAGDMETGVDDMAADMEMDAEMEPETGVEIYDPGMGPDDFSPDKGSEVDMGDDMADLDGSAEVDAVYDMDQPVEDDIEEEAEYDYRTNDVHPHAWAGTADKKPVQTGTKRVSARSGDNPLEEAAPGGSDSFETYIEDATSPVGEIQVRVEFDWDSGDFDTGMDHMPVANMGSSLEITSVTNMETGEDILETLSPDVIARLEQEASEQEDGSQYQESAAPKSFADYIKEAELNELSRGTVSNYVKKVNDDNYDDADTHKLAKRGRGLDNAQAKIYWGDAKVPTSEDLMNEFTQLDELSSDTKQSYVDKAKASKAHHEKKAGDADDRLWDRWASKNISGKSSPEAEARLTKYMNKHDAVAKKREKGLDRAGASTDQMDESDYNSVAKRARENSKQGYVQHVDRHDDGRHSVSDWMSDKTVGSFSNGHHTNGQDIEEEALDELSNATKNSYFKKAAAQINQHGQHAANDRELGNHASADDHEAVMMKRAHGMNKAIAKEGELDEAGASDYAAKSRQYGTPFYLNTDCGYASLNDLGTHDYFGHGGVVVLEIDRNGKKGLNYVAGHDSTPPGTKVTCVTATSTGQKYRPGKVVDSFTMDEYTNDRAGLEKRLAAHGISPTKKLSVKTFD